MHLWTEGIHQSLTKFLCRIGYDSDLTTVSVCPFQQSLMKTKLKGYCSVGKLFFTGGTLSY